MVASRAASAILLAFVAAASGCSGGPSAFACKSSDECRLDTVVGTCQPDGWCSFPDDTCPSSERYGMHAGDGNAGLCVAPPGDASTGSASGDATVSGGDASATSGPTAPMPEPPSSGGSLTLGVGSSGDDTDEGSSSSAPASSGHGESSGSTGEPEPLPCDLDEEFLGNALDAMTWGSWTQDGVTITLGGGVITFALPAGVVSMAGIQTEAGDLHGRAITMVIAAGPNPQTTAEQALILNDSGDDFRITITGGEVIVTVWDGSYSVLAAEPIDVQTHDHIRVGEQDGVMFVERSAGDASWDTLWEGPPPVEISDLTLTARVQTWEPVMQPGNPAWDAIRICPLP